MDRTTWSAANASSPLVQLCPAAQRVLDNGFTRVPTLNNADPPRHAPMRKAVLSVMTPSRLRSLEAGLRAYAQDLILGFRDEPVIDFVERFSFPLASFAGFNLLGFPASDSDILKEWGDTRALLTYGRTPEEDQVAAAEAVLSMWKYVEGHVAARDAEPHEDLTSDLIRLSRERPEQLNEADIVNIIYSMALASQETTSSSLSNGLLALLRNRDQWERLLAEPELIPNATEEILRFDGSVLSHRRVAKVDTKVGEFDVPAGSPIMMCFASANHDPVAIRSRCRRLPGGSPRSRTPSGIWPRPASLPGGAAGAPRDPSRPRVALCADTSHRSGSGIEARIQPQGALSRPALTAGGPSGSGRLASRGSACGAGAVAVRFVTTFSHLRERTVGASRRDQLREGQRSGRGDVGPS